MLPEKEVISQKKVVTFLAVTNYATRDQFGWIQVGPHQETLRYTLVLQLRKGLRRPDKKAWAGRTGSADGYWRPPLL